MNNPSVFATTTPSPRFIVISQEQLIGKLHLSCCRKVIEGAVNDKTLCMLNYMIQVYSIINTEYFDGNKYYIQLIVIKSLYLYFFQNKASKIIIILILIVSTIS